MAFPKEVFVDTSFWFAAMVVADVNHEHAGTLLEEATVVGSRFHTTRDVMSETLTLLRYRDGARSALLFARDIVPTIDMVVPDSTDHAAALEVFRRLAPRRRLSYCDAVSFVIVRHRLHDMACLAFDRDYRALGLTVLA
jgi:predicted nucleic acid-binding protein